MSIAAENALKEILKILKRLEKKWKQ